MIALRVSSCRGNIDVFGQRLHLPLQVRRRELLATVYADTRSVATMAPTGAFPRHSGPEGSGERMEELDTPRC